MDEGFIRQSRHAWQHLCIWSCNALDGEGIKIGKFLIGTFVGREHCRTLLWAAHMFEHCQDAWAETPVSQYLSGFMNSPAAACQRNQSRARLNERV